MSDLRQFKRLLDEIKWLDAEQRGREFLLTGEKTLKEIKQVFYTVEALKWLHENNISMKCYESGQALYHDFGGDGGGGGDSAEWFSFAAAADMLGLTVRRLDPAGGSTAGENLARLLETAPFTDIIGIRDPLPTGPDGGHAYMKAAIDRLEHQWETVWGKPWGKAPGKSSGKSVTDEELANQRPGIVNLQCDRDHPVQVLAYLMRMKHYFRSLERLVGKKMVITWVHPGASSPPGGPAPLSLVRGMVGLMTRLGMAVTLAHPPEYALPDDIPETARENVRSPKEFDVTGTEGGGFELLHSREDALKDAHIVFPVYWPGAGQDDAFVHWQAPAPPELPDGGPALSGPFDEPPVPLVLGDHRSGSLKPFIVASLILTHRFVAPYKLLAALKKRNLPRVGRF